MDPDAVDARDIFTAVVQMPPSLEIEQAAARICPGFIPCAGRALDNNGTGAMFFPGAFPNLRTLME